MVLQERPRSQTPAGLGLVIDLLNTLDLRRYGDSPYSLGRDELSSPEALRAWLSSRQLPAPDLAEDNVELVRGFREQLRGILQAPRTRTKLDFTVSVPLFLEFSSDGTPVLDPRDRGGVGVVGRMLAAIHWAAANGTWTRLKVCASEDCQRAFYDASRNRMGRWCSMNRCGNRAKTRAYRRRRSAAAPAPTPDREWKGAVHRRPRRNVFRREGDYWSISYGGNTFRLKDAKGLHYMARLLREPGREWHVLDLVGVEESLGSGPTSERLVGKASELRPVGGVYEPILDARAKAAYEHRIEDLREQLKEAEEWGDLERGARARQEIEAISDELTRATGLGGRERALGSDAERARVNVTRVIKAVVRRIDGYCPELRHHFASTLRTGIYCSYNPDPRLPTSWQL